MLLNVTEIKYLGKTLLNQDCIHEEMKTTLNVGNVCYGLVLYLLSSWLLSKNMAIQRYKNVILPVVLCRCQTWSLTVREEQGIRLFRNWMLNEILGLRWRNVKSHKELYVYWRNEIKEDEIGQSCGMWEGGEMRIIFWCGNEK